MNKSSFAPNVINTKVQSKKGYQGFTLLEMLIVMGVIAVLVLLFVPNLTSQKQGIDAKGDDAFRKAVETQVELYYLENGKYPESIGDLKLTEEQKKKAENLNPPIEIGPH